MFKNKLIQKIQKSLFIIYLMGIFVKIGFASSFIKINTYPKLYRYLYESTYEFEPFSLNMNFSGNEFSMFPSYIRRGDVDDFGFWAEGDYQLLLNTHLLYEGNQYLGSFQPESYHRIGIGIDFNE